MALQHYYKVKTTPEVAKAWAMDEPPEPITHDWNKKSKCPGKWFQKHKWKVFYGPIKGDCLFYRVWRTECQLCGQWIQRPSRIAFSEHAGALEYSPFHKGSSCHYEQCEFREDL